MSHHKKHNPVKSDPPLAAPGDPSSAIPPESADLPQPDPQTPPQSGPVEDNSAFGIPHSALESPPRGGTTEPPAPRAPQARLQSLLERGRDAGRRVLGSNILFWTLFALILAAGALLRTYRMDMPPIDFPADRQNTNFSTIEMIRNGKLSLISLSNPFTELRLYNWITARSGFLCRIFGCELWTLARFWSALFGVLAIAMAACAGYWAAATPEMSPGRRRRLALLFMAALAFNPYHLQLSRIIATESFTLAMQMCAVACFWIAYRHPHKLSWFLAFAAFFILSGWAKIPSVIWLPAFAVYFLGHPVLRGRARRAGLIGLAAFALAIVAMFLIARLNPFQLFRQYEKSYPYFAQHTAIWIGSALWIKTYLSRIVLMLTLPGVLLALVGFLSAPWLFRLTTLVFLFVFYGLINLNTYNFCHIIIPGMALAAWGADALIETASGAVRPPIAGIAGLESGLKRLNQALAVALLGLFILWLAPAGPDSSSNPRPRGEVLQALKVAQKLVPAGTAVYHDDGENAFSYLFSRISQNLLTDATFAPDKLDLRTGYYFLFERFTDRPLHYAGTAWVKWASLPGEPGGILYAHYPTAPPAGLKFTPLTQPQAAPTTATVAAAQAPATTSPLTASACLMPAGPYDAARRTLIVHPGTTVTLGLTWNNPRQFPLAGVRWIARTWDRPIAVPVREGGFAMAKGGVLCLPEGRTATAYYTFEIPAGFPAGEYAMETYPMSPGPWHEPEHGAQTLPFRIVCDAGEVPPPDIERLFSQVYPAQYYVSPLLWSGNWFYRNMKLEGFGFNETIKYYFLACPMRPAGVYELTLRGEAEPLAGGADPAAIWPAVEVFLPSSRQAAAARVLLNSRREREFKATFTAAQPFDSLMLRATAEFGKETPLWLTDFSNEKFGIQVLNLRGIRLTLQRKIIDGLAEELRK